MLPYPGRLLVLPRYWPYSWFITGDSGCAEMGISVFPSDIYFIYYGLVCITCWYVVSCNCCFGYITSISVVRKLTSYIGLLVYSQIWVYVV
jgi:hypothetical protein